MSDSTVAMLTMCVHVLLYVSNSVSEKHHDTYNVNNFAV